MTSIYYTFKAPLNLKINLNKNLKDEKKYASFTYHGNHNRLFL